MRGDIVRPANGFKNDIRMDSLDRYLREINSIPLLAPQEEVDLARKIRRGDHKALEKLTLANLRFVVSVAKQYQNQGLSLADIINEGNLGLIKAATRFDESRGFKFISYAVWWIRQSILQALAEQSRIVRIPLNRVGTMNKIDRMMSKLSQTFEREPTETELADVLHIGMHELLDLLRNTGKPISLDSPLDDDEDSKLIDILEAPDTAGPDQQLLGESLDVDINSSLQSLEEREAQVIRMYFGLCGDRPLTLEEIGAKLTLTRERVRQIKEKALRRLRHSSRSTFLRKYLG
jgi:RNA polymerase primary sigma factor